MTPPPSKMPCWFFPVKIQGKDEEHTLSLKEIASPRDLIQVAVSRPNPMDSKLRQYFYINGSASSLLSLLRMRIHRIELILTNTKMEGLQPALVWKASAKKSADENVAALRFTIGRSGACFEISFPDEGENHASEIELHVDASVEESDTPMDVSLKFAAFYTSLEQFLEAYLQARFHPRYKPDSIPASGKKRQ